MAGLRGGRKWKLFDILICAYYIPAKRTKNNEKRVDVMGLMAEFTSAFWHPSKEANGVIDRFRQAASDVKVRRAARQEARERLIKYIDGAPGGNGFVGSIIKTPPPDAAAMAEFNAFNHILTIQDKGAGQYAWGILRKYHDSEARHRVTTVAPIDSADYPASLRMVGETAFPPVISYDQLPTLLEQFVRSEKGMQAVWQERQRKERNKSLVKYGLAAAITVAGAYVLPDDDHPKAPEKGGEAPTEIVTGANSSLQKPAAPAGDSESAPVPVPE